MLIRKPRFSAVVCVLGWVLASVPAWGPLMALERPGVEFKIFQFPAGALAPFSLHRNFTAILHLELFFDQLARKSEFLQETLSSGEFLLTAEFGFHASNLA